MQKSSDKHYNTHAIDKMDVDFISAECLEKLGLDQNPFIDHARDPFIFTDTQLEMSMNVLMDYLLNQNSTLILLGELGIGKTTHLRMLLRKGYQQFNFCTLRAKPNITFAEIEDKLRERWTLPQKSVEDISLLDIDSNEYLSTDEYIKQYIEDGKHPVLIIDDAHRLQSNVLDDLLKLKHHVALQSQKALGLVLASEPLLKTQLSELEQTNPAATQIYQINVRSFDVSQCAEYIEYRMGKAGEDNNDLISQEKITEIYTRSKGLPKYINKLAREEISTQCSKKRPSRVGPSNKIKSSPSMRLGLILAGLIGLAAIFATVSKNSNKPDESVALDLNKQKVEKEIKQKNIKLDKKPSEKPQAKLIEKPYVAPLVLGPLQDKESSTEDSAISSKAKTTEKSKPEKTQAITQNKSNTPATSSEWILQQDPNAFTIQIVASPNEKNLLDFAKQNSLNENTAFYKKTTDEKHWFVLVHGAYKSRTDALSAIEKLSDKLKKNKPYPVQIKYLHEVIRQP